MRNARQGTSAASILAMIVASVLVHLVLWPVGDKVVGFGWGGPPIPISGGVFEVSLLPVDATEDERLAEPEPAEHDDEHRVVAPGELVELDKLTDERPPEDTKFISEFDNR